MITLAGGTGLGRILGSGQRHQNQPEQAGEEETTTEKEEVGHGVKKRGGSKVE